MTLALFVGAVALVRRHPAIGMLTVACSTALALVLGFVILRDALTRFDPSPPLDRGSWESEVGIGPRAEDPALVRELREAAGASGTVAVEVTVFDSGPR